MRILKIHSLPPSTQWVDRDEIMLHACFQVLKDCVEKENLIPKDSVETECEDKVHEKYVDEARFLYNWWNQRTNNDDNYTIEQTKEDDEMLIRLMNIRTFLWT